MTGGVARDRAEWECVEQSDRELAARFKKRLVAMLGPRLLRLRAFGSRARGLCRPDSDLDLMVVVDSADHETRKAIVFLGADMMLEETDPVALSPFVVDPERIARLKERERRLILDIEREGVEI